VFDDQALDPAIHDREAFESGVGALDDYLRRFAAQHRLRGISSTFVLTESIRPDHILGYYSLSAAEVDVQRIADSERKRLPRYPVPCIRMGRLAVRSDQQGRGLGKLMVACAVDRCMQVRRQIAAYALLVDAKDLVASAFYEHMGFKTLSDTKSTLYLALGK